MRRHAEVGQTLVFVALGMVMLGAILGLAVDIGYMRFLKRQLQTAADSAAIAGAAEVNYGDVTAAAKADAASNGFTDGSGGVTVTVNNPPGSGAYHGTSGFVEVLISKSQPTFFIRIVPGGATNSTVQARAVAYLGNAKGCIYSLSPSPGAITIHHSVNLTAQNCAIIDNGDLTAHNSTTITASAIGVAGTVSNLGGQITPTPQQGMIPASDPLAFLPKQNPGGCDFTNLNINSGHPPNLNQGVYCGGIMITGSAVVTFNPGLYITTPNGGVNPGLVINSSGTVTGNGVTFYNAAGSGPVSITSPGTVSLTAPTSGDYAGILVFQDPANASSATVNAGNNSMFQGALYFPNLNATLTIDDVGSGAAYMIVVAGSLAISTHNINLGSDYSSLSNGSPIKDALLVE